MPLNKRKSEHFADDADIADSKRAKTGFEKAPRREDEEGKPYWELSKSRRVNLSSFKGQTFVAIRDYYEKDGKTLPGKTGINLKIEQLAALMLALPEITQALQAEGFSLPEVSFSSKASDATPESDKGGDAAAAEVDDVHDENGDVKSEG